MTDHLDTLRLCKRMQATQSTYADHAFIQQEISSRALSRLQYIKQAPQRIVDLSLHCGDSEATLRHAFPAASYIATSPIFENLQLRKRRLFKKLQSVCIPFTALPFAESSADFIFMNLRLLWTLDWPHLLRECYRILRPQGMLLFTTLGPDTLRELRDAFATIDDYAHVQACVDMHDIGDVLLQVGFENPVMDMEYVQAHYKRLSQLTGDLKRTGFNYAGSMGRRAVLTPRQWYQVESQYKKLDTQELCATFEFVYGHAWVGGHKRQFLSNYQHEVSIPLETLRLSASK